MMSVSQPQTDAAIVIRPMQAEDLPEVQAIDQMAFAMPWPASAYRYELYDNPHSLLWVAEAIGPSEPGDQTPGPDEVRRVVGMIVVWLIIDEAHIATIAVHPDYRGQGIAAELMAAALGGALDHRMLTATLEVRAHNPPAHKLYQRFKFDVVGRRPRYYRDNNEDALIMTISKLDQTYRDWLASEAWKNHTENTNEQSG